MNRPYRLTLTAGDVETIAFVGWRYCWSSVLCRLVDEGENQLTEPEAWAIREACEADTEGGHSYFPMLADCELRDKLHAFLESIV